MLDDSELLRRFVEQGSAEAFDTLARRHLDLIYSVALRRCGGDAPMAKDVTQMVLLDLARKARVLQQRASIVGWLHTAARYAAATLLRDERTRKAHEIAAATLGAAESSDARDAEWRQLRPVLDDALGELREGEREAVLLRYFQGHSYAIIGRILLLTETAARARVDRALERLRRSLAHRGIESTTAALGSAILRGATTPMPADLASAAIAAAVAGGLGTAVSFTGASTGAFFSAGKLAAVVADLLAMKAITVLLVVSLAANAALGSLCYVGRPPVPDYTRFAGISMAPVPAPEASPGSAATNVEPGTAAGSIATKLDLTDQATLIRKMEEDGFDRASIARAIRGLYTHHSRPWMNEQLNVRHSMERRWNVRPLEPGIEEWRKRYSQRDAEALTAVAAAGYSIADLGVHYSADSPSPEKATPFLDTGKTAAVRRIEKDYAELTGSVNTTSIRWEGRDGKSGGVIWPEFEKDIRAALSPSEAALYFRIQSPAAEQVQRALRSNSTFDLPRESYDAIVDDVVAGKSLAIAFRQHVGDERFVAVLEGFDKVAASADSAYRVAGLSAQRRADLFLRASLALGELRAIPPESRVERTRQLHDELVQSAGLSGSQLEAFHSTTLGLRLLEIINHPPQ